MEDINEKDTKQIADDEVETTECAESIEEVAQDTDVEETSPSVSDQPVSQETDQIEPTEQSDGEDDDSADIDYMIDKAVDCASSAKKTTPKHAKKTDDAVDKAEEKDTSEESGGKSVLRRHSLSTGILIIWFVAVAIICLMIGGFGGATWQRGSDERAFDVERTALNEKIATLESKAEEDQKELVELREFRGKLEELVMEYMVEDTTAARNALDSNTNVNTNVNGNTSGNVNSNTENTNTGGGPGSFLDFLFGGGSNNNENTNTNVPDNMNANTNTGSTGGGDASPTK